jgi:hypothetical protein
MLGLFHLLYITPEIILDNILYYAIVWHYAPPEVSVRRVETQSVLLH